ncbi:MAG: OmpA family protein [Candidatus Kapabacteria bacterium]|nr:OmpA family protein [Candidatus Kapabacteria bacterium]
MINKQHPAITVATVIMTVATFFIAMSTLVAAPCQPLVSDTVRPVNLGPNVNGKFDDVLPVIAPDGRTLYFCRSNSPENVGGMRQDIWMSTLQDDSTWSKAVNVGPPLNNRENNHMFSITPDGNLALINDAYSDAANPNRALAVTKRTATGWGKPTPITIRNWYTKSFHREFSLANDGKTLLITAERLDSRGGKDVYVSFRENDSVWSEPRNLGQVVNSTGDEATPFIASDGISLYFASDGRGGYGGFDIFVTKRLDSTWTSWSEPENLGPTINSKRWDLYYTIPARGDYAYFVSYDNTIGAGDIFRVLLPAKVRPNPVVLVYGTVMNKKTMQPLEAEVVYEDLATGREIGIARSAPGTGSYKIVLPAGLQYGFRASARDVASVSYNLDLTKQTDYAEIQRDLYLVPLEQGQALPLNNIFFDYAKSTLRAESFSELDRVVMMMTESASMRIEVGGHTDSRGNDATNRKLSQDRAQAVVDYLVGRGVAVARLAAIGYGKTRPTATNDTEEGRQLNRRVEITILQP